MSDKSAKLTAAPEGYVEWLANLEARIHTAEQHAVLVVNHESVLLYWQIGRDILTRQAKQHSGAKIINRPSQDMRSAFPKMKDLSLRNLKYMWAFA